MIEELQAARLRLVKTHPYLAAAAWALHPVERPGLGSLAVDQWWRLYYDPAVVAAWPVEELSGVLYHEISHLLRDHPGRLQELERAAANVAADAEINDDLKAERIALPDGCIYPEMFGQPDGLLAEEYYIAIALQEQDSAPDQGASAQPDGADDDPEAGDDQQRDGSEAGQETADNSETAPGDGASSSADHGGDDGDQPEPSLTGQGGGQANDDQLGDRGDGSGSKSGDPGGSTSSGSSDQPESSSQPPGSPGSGPEAGTDGGEPGDQAQTPAPGAGRCGSCATGQQEPWEDGPPGAESPGTGRAEAEMIRRDVARQIAEHSRDRGTVPGHWARWADEKLKPKVNWRRELATAIRHAVADVAGAVDYSYRKPSRRQGQVGNGKVVLPSLRHPIPSVAVVVDTSGSMSDAMLSQALAEVSGILKGMGQREGVHVIACDAQAHACKKVFSPRQIQLAGGGGTDMGEGIAEAMKLRPQPQVIVVITDGYTPWPDAVPRARVIVALTDDGNAPPWAKAVKVGDKNA